MDVDSPYTLLAVSQAGADLRADGDPSVWVPPASQHRCRYLTEWVSTKWRWRLSVDPHEHRALSAAARKCSHSFFVPTEA
ncbi:hypothetical protein [Streptomyces sp. NPDC005533]|uniref:hypothetical protein n=1 Tax=Streptomyces sp. NPDC005533 TaxID=3364723 RepID=UPI0036CEA2F4